MIANYLKIAWRNLFKNKTHSFINLFGLSVGMAAAILILLWVQNEMSVNGYHARANDIYRITNKIKISANETWTWESSPMLMGDAAKDAIPEIEQAVRLYPKESSVIHIGNSQFTETKAAYVEDNWFDVFDYNFISGDAAAFGKNPYDVILTESKAKTYFGNNNPVGQALRIGQQNYTVAGVIANNPINSSFQFDMLLVLDTYVSAQLLTAENKGWGNFNYLTFLKLRPDANITQVNQKVNAVLVENKKDNSITASLQPLHAIYFEEGLQSSSLRNGNKKTTYIFSALAILLLGIACINYVNLTTARASIRSKEVSIRKIAGARQDSLFYQFMTESLVVSFVALLITLVLVKLSLPAFNNLTEKEFVLSLSSATVWKVLGGTLLMATVLNGIYPAMLLSSFQPMQVFRGQSILKINDASLRKGLVVFQFGLSVVLIVSTIVIFKQLQFMQQSDPGYRAEQVITLELPYNDQVETGAFYSMFKNSLQSKSSITSVSMAGSPVIELNSFSSGNADWNGRDTTFNPSMVQFNADAGFKDVLGLQISEGRWFAAGEQDQYNYIINETAVEQFRLQQPVIGQRFTVDGINGQIVGVIKDFHYKNMREKIRPMVVRNSLGKGHFVFVKASAGNSSKAVREINAIWNQQFPSEPFNYTFLDETFNTTYKADIRMSNIILIFSFIAVGISALGLFGLAAFTAQQRTREIGIRKVLGASVASVISLLSGDFMKLVLIAIAIGCLPAWYFMDQWLQDFAYRIAIKPWMFIITAVFALVIAFLTISFQAVKSALSNPVDNLK